ncbi:MAG: hypothetical protein IPO28_13620 [Holophagaceae bacterium]|nr:hypothetical protein [Holophagaceae bacterium]
MDEDDGAPLEQEGPPSEDRLIRLRRRSRRFLIIMPDDLDRSIFAATLQVGGYSCFFLKGREPRAGAGTVKKELA